MDTILQYLVNDSLKRLIINQTLPRPLRHFSKNWHIGVENDDAIKK